MIRNTPIAPILVLCATGAALAQQNAAVSEQAAHEAADTIAKQFAAAYNAGNPAGIATLFAQGGIYLTPGGTALTDRQEIEKAIAGRMKTGWTKEAVTVTEAHPAGNEVWSIGQYAIAGTGQNSGKQIGGYYVDVLTREGSDWRFRMLIANLKPTQDVTGMAAATSK